jgi:Aldo/keto reductase family
LSRRSRSTRRTGSTRRGRRRPRPRKRAPMRYRRLGPSDLEVSEISLGSWLTFAGGVEFEQTRACTDAAFEAGINFFDTANVYGRGAAESAWGAILSGRPRESYVLATKVWGQMSEDPTDRGLSARQIAKQIDASLERLQTDYVDLYRHIALTPTFRSRRRSKRSRRSSPPARRATSASASGRPSRSKRRSTSRGPTCSSPRSRSTPCCGRRPRRRSSPSARPTTSRRSCGRRSPRGCSPASTDPARRRRPTPARRATVWGASSAGS